MKIYFRLSYLILSNHRSLALFLSLLQLNKNFLTSEYSVNNTLNSNRIIHDPLSIRSNENINENESISKSLIILPSFELLNQYLSWSRCIFKNYNDLNDNIGTLFRSKTLPIETQVLNLKSYKQKLILSTPNGLLDAYNFNNDIFNPLNNNSCITKNLSTLVLDEVDSLLPPSANIRQTKSRQMVSKKKKKNFIYPLIEILLKSNPSLPKLQFVAASASLNAPLRGHLKVEKRWLNNNYNYINDTTINNQGKVKHSCVVINNSGDVRNIQVHNDENKSSKALQQKRQEISNSITSKLIKYDENLFESIAAAFAIWSNVASLSSNALLIVPSDSSIKQLEDFFDSLGIHARQILNVNDTDSTPLELNVSAQDSDSRTLYITHQHSLKGLHIPSLELVMIAGPINDANDYAHAAGRVGRLGQMASNPTVVTFVRESNSNEGVTSPEEATMIRTFQRINVRPQPWETVLEN